MEKETLLKPQQKTLNERLEDGEFDQEVTEMITKLGLVDSSMSFHGFEAVDAYTKATTPEDLRFGAKDILNEVKFSSAVSVGRAQVASMEVEWQKKFPNDNRVKQLIQRFDAFYESPTDENHESFLEAYKDMLVQLNQEREEQNEEEQKSYKELVGTLADLEEDLYLIQTEQRSVNYSKAREHASDSVKINAEIHGVEKARDIMTDTLSQQIVTV